MIKLRHQVLRGLPVVMLVYSLPAPAQAQFTQQGPKLAGTGAIGNAEQGISVAISGDGSTGIVGGHRDDSDAGAVWVFTRSEGVWSQQGTKLIGSGAAGSAARQGYSVAISGDGNTAIFAGPNDNPSPTDGIFLYTGAVWVFTRSEGVWSQQGSKLVVGDTVGLPPYGFSDAVSVAISGDGNTAIVGGNGDNGTVGAAWVFTRSDGAWTQQAKLVGMDAVGGSFEGSSVSLSSDGNTAIVGAPFDNNQAGAAWVFARSGTMWMQQAKLVGALAHYFGGSVSLSADGNTAIVGVTGDPLGPNGSAWVYTRSGDLWNQQARLVGTGAVGGAEGGPHQGASVSLSADGNTATVGGDGDNNGVGAAWVFTRSGSVWTQFGMKLVGTNVAGAARQGYSVSLSGKGNYAIVGAPFDNNHTGASWAFARPVFAGTPGKASCYGQSVSALTKQYGGLNGAAAALALDNVNALQGAIDEFCVT